MGGSNSPAGRTGTCASPPPPAIAAGLEGRGRGLRAPGKMQQESEGLTLQLAAGVASGLALRIPLLLRLCLRPDLGGQLHREGGLPTCTHGEAGGLQRAQEEAVGGAGGGRRRERDGGGGGGASEN